MKFKASYKVSVMLHILKNRLNDSHALLNSLNGYLRQTCTFLDQLKINIYKKIPYF
jgi:hypothetical protein